MEEKKEKGPDFVFLMLFFAIFTIALAIVVFLKEQNFGMVFLAVGFLLMDFAAIFKHLSE